MRDRAVLAIALVALMASGCATGKDSTDRATDGSTNTAPATVADGSASSNSTRPPTSTATSTLAVVESVDEITGLFTGERQDAWEAWDGVDPDPLRLFFADRGTWDGMIVGDEQFTASMEYWAALGWREWDEQCVHVSPGYARCNAPFTTALHEPAGLVFTVHRQVWLDGDGLITAISGLAAIPGIHEFDEAFDAWLANTHPDIAATLYRWHDPDRDSTATKRAVEVVGEFIESSDQYPVDEPAPVDEPVLTEHAAGVAVYNATPVQVGLVEWALARFDEAGLAMPPVDQILFPPTAACMSGVSGRAYHNGTSGSVDVCAHPTAFTEPGLPITGRRSILHELGHIWVIGHTDDQARANFMELRGISAWTGAAWEDNGFEQAAEVITWALMDDPIEPRIPHQSDAELEEAYATLTGLRSLRASDTSDG